MAETVKVPWEQDGEEFDAEKAKGYLNALLSDKEKLKERLQSTSESKRGASAREKELQKENTLLKVQMKTGLSDRQIQRLVGDTEEALLEDASLFAEETGIELNDFTASVGAPGDNPDGDEGAGNEEPKQYSTNYRTPQGQTAGSHEAPDLKGIIETMQF